MQKCSLVKITFFCVLTGRQGIVTTLKQSDMCLVCIAFASWVLRSSDPEAADAWKAGMTILVFCQSWCFSIILLFFLIDFSLEY